MDLSKSTRIVSSRIQEIEPEHACDIVTYLLNQDNGEQDMIRLAFSPDNVIKTATERVKCILGLSFSHQQIVYSAVCSYQTHHYPMCKLPIQFKSHQEPCHSWSFSSTQRSLPCLPHLNSSCWNDQGFSQINSEGYGVETHCQQLLTFDEHLDSASLLDLEMRKNCYHPKVGLDGSIMEIASKRSHNLSGPPPKVCHYFNKGFCKHGTNCRYIHDNQFGPESLSQLLGPCSNENRNGYRNGDNHIGLSLKSLEKLEREIIELLKSRKESPVSIASLPMLYYEKYGRTIQAEGYLTESQRHGKVGYSLTKLLARLKNSVRVIDRPHGQHSVILVEDVPKYLKCTSDRTKQGGIIPWSQQIYLTFPAESTFTENDVANYFNKYGHVQEVRIPCVQKRMFGFVTFLNSETVRKILDMGNPHFVCGARVLVKPYKEKSRLMDRKHPQILQQLVHYDSQLLDEEFNFQSAYGCSRQLRKQFLEEHKEAFESRKTHFSEQQTLSNLVNDSKFRKEFQTLQPFIFGLNTQKDDFGNDDNFRNVIIDYSNQESDQGFNLPDNPFATQ